MIYDSKNNIILRRLNIDVIICINFFMLIKFLSINRVLFCNIMYGVFTNNLFYNEKGICLWKKNNVF